MKNNELLKALFVTYNHSPAHEDCMSMHLKNIPHIMKWNSVNF